MSTIDVGLYPARVILATKRKRFAKLREQYGDRPPLLDLDDCDGCSSEFGSTYLVGVFNGAPGVLLHELAHTTFKILRDVSVPVHHDGSQEAFCYLQQWLFDQLLPSI